MLKKVLLVMLVSMVPLIELRGGVPMAVAMGIPGLQAIVICGIANMIPVPIIYMFARKVLVWGADKAYIGKIFRVFLEKGEKAGRKLTEKASRSGTFVALMLFVGIPLPGTGAWTGTLAASLLNLGWKTTTGAVSLGVVMAGIIMAVGSSGLFAMLGF